MNSLRKLKRVVRDLEGRDHPHPEYLYPGDFVRCKVDGEVYIVTVRWDSTLSVYKWNLISLSTGMPLEGMIFDDWVSSTSCGDINRDEFWDNSDPDWEVLNTNKEDSDHDCN